MSLKSVTRNPATSFEIRRSPFPGHSHSHPAGTSFLDERVSSPWKRLARAIGPPAMGVSVVLLIPAIFRHAQLANVTTVGFTFLLAILIASVFGGLRTSVLMSVAATLAYDYFFIPPVGSLNIKDYRDWVALSAFLIISVVGSTLSARARRQRKKLTAGGGKPSNCTIWAKDS